jgi:hypothetical protein
MNLNKRDITIKKKSKIIKGDNNSNLTVIQDNNERKPRRSKLEKLVLKDEESVKPRKSKNKKKGKKRMKLKPIKPKQSRSF